MANSSFETQLDVLNKNLKVDGVGKVYISRRAFYLKAYLPDKYNPNWDELKQRWVATGLKAEKSNIKQVEKIARKLHYESHQTLFGKTGYLLKKNLNQKIRV